MRQSSMRALAGAGIAAAMLFGSTAVWAAATPSEDVNGWTIVQPKPQVKRQTWDDIWFAKAPPSDRQAESDRVEAMSRRVQQDVAAVHPGEDFLGSGTSMTH